MAAKKKAPKTRNQVARAAWGRNGGPMADGRTGRLRTRGAKKADAIRDSRQ